MNENRIHFVASSVNEGTAALEALKNRYGQTPLEDASVIVSQGSRVPGWVAQSST